MSPITAATTTKSSYTRLEEAFAETAQLAAVLGFLSWDQQTHMPAGGGAARAEQIATLTRIRHQRLTDPRLLQWADEALELGSNPGSNPGSNRGSNLGSGRLGLWQQANLREMRRQLVRTASVPRELAVAIAHASSRTELAWRSARADNDFRAVAPLLGELLSLVKDKAAALGQHLGCEPYAALLDGYDPGRTVAEIDATFAEVEEFVPPVLAAAQERQARAGPPRGQGTVCPIERQRQLAQRVLRTLRFDPSHGRLDESEHPFTGGTPDDIRITTRYRAGDFTDGLMATIHETGHAHYERGLPAQWRNQPVGGACGLTVHESQSLLFEKQIGRSAAFLSWLAPQLRETLGADTAFEFENLVRVFRHVLPSHIRVASDEVTYPLHIVIRTRLERALLAGDLPVGDLPAAWNEQSRKRLGIEPPSLALGCLQDVHWYSGAYGYFPTYLLGALGAAQIYAAARHSLPHLEDEIRAGNLEPLLAWLREKIHRFGTFFSVDELFRQATGQPLSAQAWKHHIRARYVDDAS